jgi:hypothetical protein
VIKYNTTTRSEGIIVRQGDNVKYLAHKKDMEAKQKILLNLECNSSTFFLKKTANENFMANISSCELPWIVVRHFKSINEQNVTNF